VELSNLSLISLWAGLVQDRRDRTAEHAVFRSSTWTRGLGMEPDLGTCTYPVQPHTVLCCGVRGNKKLRKSRRFPDGFVSKHKNMLFMYSHVADAY
jgi:hypothetical protein